MPQGRQTPSLNGIIERQEARIAKLEKRLSQVIDARRTPLYFSFPGSVQAMIGVESEQLRPIHPTRIDLIVADVLTVPSGADIDIDLTLYGPSTGVVRTITIPNGFSYVEDSVPFVIPIGGRLTATVTGSDSGAASDLSIAMTPRLL